MSSSFIPLSFLLPSSNHCNICVVHGCDVKLCFIFTSCFNIFQIVHFFRIIRDYITVCVIRMQSAALFPFPGETVIHIYTVFFALWNRRVSNNYEEKASQSVNWCCINSCIYFSAWGKNPVHKSLRLRASPNLGMESICANKTSNNVLYTVQDIVDNLVTFYFAQKYQSMHAVFQQTMILYPKIMTVWSRELGGGDYMPTA